MADWPTSLDPPWLAFEEENYNPAIKTEFEAGYTQTRPRFTRAKKRFTLKWNYMPDAQVTDLRTFYEDTVVGGTAFAWTHPVSGTPYAVRFVEDELVCNRLSVRYWEVSVRLEEV